MRLKVFVATSTNLFDKKYLWQDKIKSEDVKGSVIEFLSQIKSDRLGGN
jgi:hypothetical protein